MFCPPPPLHTCWQRWGGYFFSAHRLAALGGDTIFLPSPTELHPHVLNPTLLPAQVSNTEVHYRAMAFYLEEHPELLVDLLNVLQVCACVGGWVGLGGATPRAASIPIHTDVCMCGWVGAGIHSCVCVRLWWPLPPPTNQAHLHQRCPSNLVTWTPQPCHPPARPCHPPWPPPQSRVDHSRVVDMMRQSGNLPLIKDYLLGVQKNNLTEVKAGWWWGGAGCGGCTTGVMGQGWLQLRHAKARGYLAAAWCVRP